MNIIPRLAGGITDLGCAYTSTADRQRVQIENYPPIYYYYYYYGEGMSWEFQGGLIHMEYLEKTIEKLHGANGSRLHFKTTFVFVRGMNTYGF